MTAQLKEARLFTYADYKEWELAEGERFELIYGEAFAMAAPSEIHQLILVDLCNQLYNYLLDKSCVVIPAPYDVRLFFEGDEYDDTVVQPDISVVCDAKKRGPEGCRGAPDLVVEILSPTNMAIEMERKFQLYRDAGVREYWVVDPENRGIKVYLFGSSSIVVNTYRDTGAFAVQTLPGLNINLARVFAKIVPAENRAAGANKI